MALGAGPALLLPWTLLLPSSLQKGNYPRCVLEGSELPIKMGLERSLSVLGDKANIPTSHLTSPLLSGQRQRPGRSLPRLSWLERVIKAEPSEMTK